MASIKKRGDSYQITVSLGYDASGKKIRQTKSYTPKKDMTPKQIEKEILKISTLFEDQVKNGMTINSAIKFETYAEQWMHTHAETELRSTTIYTYNNMLKSINKYIGFMRLDRIQPRTINELNKSLREQGKVLEASYKSNKLFRDLYSQNKGTKDKFCKDAHIVQATLRKAISGENISRGNAEKIAKAMGYNLSDLFVKNEKFKSQLSSKSLQNYHRLVSSILETAVKEQLIPYNPCSRVSSPKVVKKDARYLEDDEIDILLEKLEEQPLEFRCLINLYLFSGMRRGEALGLTWNDIDFENNLIDINKSSLYISSRGIYKSETKNKSSNRVIKVPPTAMNLLKEWKKEQSKIILESGTAWIGERGESRLIFTREDGIPIHPTTVTAKFHKFVIDNDLPDICVHSLRHTNASLLIGAKTNIETVAKRLGHAQTSTTMDIYGHAFRTADAIASDSIEEALTKRKKA